MPVDMANGQIPIMVNMEPSLRSAILGYSVKDYDSASVPVKSFPLLDGFRPLLKGNKRKQGFDELGNLVHENALS